jgi:hypothetical protein
VANTDADWIKSLDKITDPREALQTIIDNELYFGFDPYYRDLRDAMVKMADRVLSASSHGASK